MLKKIVPVFTAYCVLIALISCIVKFYLLFRVALCKVRMRTADANGGRRMQTADGGQL